MAMRTPVWVLAGLAIACTANPEIEMTPVKVEVARTAGGYRLLRNGIPYEIRGAGMAIDDIERFAAHGGNSIRNWTTDDSVQNVRSLLDSAYENGVTVMLCLPLRPERSGFDYDDEEAVAGQFSRLSRDVLTYKDHPALLGWILGNELDISYSNPAVYDAVNELAKFIHEVDPNHPVTTTTSGFKEHVVAEIEAHAPELDFISFQVYGGLFGLPERIRAAKFDRPFMVTEWGTIGHWEMERTPWGAPVELTSSEKADVFLRGHREILSGLSGQLLGSYAFLWGQKQERTPTWFGMFTESGHETEVVDVMHYAWNGDWPDDRAPRVVSLTVDGATARDGVVLDAGKTYEAAFDVEGGGTELAYAWEVKPESDSTKDGGDYEPSIANIDGLLTGSDSGVVSLRAPAPGSYRLFAYAFDQSGHAAHANLPFLVREPASE